MSSFAGGLAAPQSSAMRDAPHDAETSPTGQKVRESCDACSTQKIRCSKERPSCSRCALKGVGCVYGMSKRTGRRKRSPHSSPYATPRPASPLALADELHLFTSLNSFDNAPWMFDTSSVDLSKDMMDFDMPYFDPSLMCTDFNPPTTRPKHDSISSSISSESIFSRPEDDLDFLFNLSPTASLQSPPPPPTSSGFTPHPTFSSAPSTGNGKTCEASQYGNGIIQGCISTALQLVAEQHARQSPVGNTRDIDTVLDNNRETLKKLSNILDCPCSHEQDVLIPVFLAAQQTMLWYEAALCVDSNNGRSSHSSTDRIVTSEAKMGNYQLDGEAQGLVRAHAVLAELRIYFQPLLVRIQRRGSNSGNDPTARLGEDQDSHVVDCYQRALRGKLSAIAAKANALRTG